MSDGNGGIDRHNLLILLSIIGASNFFTAHTSAITQAIKVQPKNKFSTKIAVESGCLRAIATMKGAKYIKNNNKVPSINLFQINV